MLDGTTDARETADAPPTHRDATRRRATARDRGARRAARARECAATARRARARRDEGKEKGRGAATRTAFWDERARARRWASRWASRSRRARRGRDAMMPRRARAGCEVRRIDARRGEADDGRGRGRGDDGGANARRDGSNARAVERGLTMRFRARCRWNGADVGVRRRTDDGDRRDGERAERSGGAGTREVGREAVVS